MAKFTLKTKNINSERLLKDVSDFIGGIITSYDIVWDGNSNRDAILEIIDEKLEDLQEDKEINQWNVICDRRNNKMSDTLRKITNLNITYQQRNCYNTTELHYIIKR